MHSFSHCINGSFIQYMKICLYILGTSKTPVLVYSRSLQTEPDIKKQSLRDGNFKKWSVLGHCVVVVLVKFLCWMTVSNFFELQFGKFLFLSFRFKFQFYIQRRVTNSIHKVKGTWFVNSEFLLALLSESGEKVIEMRMHRK